MIDVLPGFIDVLPGFREFYPPDCFIRNFIFEKMRQMCQNFGFSEYDSPILEPLELFTEKSGEEIAAQLFNFIDRGGRSVALRPEMTPAVARMIGSKINTLKRPLKWFSIEENFRYERPQKGRLRSFYQLNIDIFDEQNISADAEIIALAVAILQSLGLSANDFHVRLSDRQLWTILLQSLGVPENFITETLSIIDKIERESHDIIVEKLNALNLDGIKILENIKTFQSIRNLDILKTFLQATVQQPDLKNDVDIRLEQLKSLLKHLDDFGLTSFITLDFSIVRGLAYYTGFVFEFFERSGKSRALTGGGRYDDLIEKFGYPKTAAIGLAIGDVTLTNILQEKNLLPSFEQKCDLFMIYDKFSKPFALNDMHQLRLAGFSVTYALKENASPEKQFKQALQQSHWVATYREAKDKIILRNIDYRKDYEIQRQEIIHFLQQQR
ncbi:MAG: histidine--tRNA ligase [Puniceicoccales bacterium]|jgi:histidyl-tRNA synthetase|nr:histidine--tRNA ligase [Puniceicoccales bacterium]